MKPAAPLLLALLAAGLAAALPVAVQAQQAQQGQQGQQMPPRADVPRPPVLEKLEDEDPETRIPPKSGPQVTEKREQGKVKEVKVKTGKSEYTLRANEQPGSIQPGEGGAGNSRPAQWQIFEFDLGARKKGDKRESPDAAPVPPPPAPAPKQ